VEGLEVFRNKRKLPCQPRKKNCEVADVTYGWEKGDQECPLRLLALPGDQGEPKPTRLFTEEKIGYEQTPRASTKGITVIGDRGQNAYFSNDGLQVRLLIIGQATACGRTLLTTNDPDLFLRNADGSAPFRWEAPLPDVSISLISPLSSDFYLERQINGSYRQGVVEREFQHVMNSHCRHAGSGFILNPWLRRNDPGTISWNIGPGFYASAQGDMVCQYHCPQRYVKMREMSRCYHALPVQEVDVQRGPASRHPGLVQEVRQQGHGPALFLEPVTHRLINQGFEVSCDSEFLPTYKGLWGARIKANPGLQILGPYESDDNSSFFDKGRHQSPLYVDTDRMHRGNYDLRPVDTTPFIVGIFGLIYGVRLIYLALNNYLKFRVICQTSGKFIALRSFLFTELYLLRLSTEGLPPLGLSSYLPNPEDEEEMSLEPMIMVKPPILKKTKKTKSFGGE